LRFRLSLSIVALIAALTAVSAFAAAPGPTVTYSGSTVKVHFVGVIVSPKAKCTYAQISNPSDVIAGNEIISGFKQVGNKVSFKASFKIDADHPAHGTYTAIVQCFTSAALKNKSVPFVVNAK